MHVDLLEDANRGPEVAACLVLGSLSEGVPGHGVLLCPDTLVQLQPHAVDRGGLLGEFVLERAE